MLEVVKKNYSNPEFAKEQKAQARKAKTRELAALKEQRDQVKRAHGDALHAHCEEMIATTPVLPEEEVTALLAQDSTFRQYYQPHKSPLENYRARAFVYLSIESFLTEHYPEHFQALYVARNAELAALDEKIAALAQAV